MGDLTKGTNICMAPSDEKRDIVKEMMQLKKLLDTKPHIIKIKCDKNCFDEIVEQCKEPTSEFLKGALPMQWGTPISVDCSIPSDTIEMVYDNGNKEYLNLKTGKRFYLPKISYPTSYLNSCYFNLT